MATVSEVPDVELVVAAQQGDAEAFSTLFDRWFDRVHDVAWRIVRDRDTAMEVSQDVFLVTWQKLGTIEQPASFGGWLLRTARNRALNRLARERRTVALGNEETTMEIDRHAGSRGPGDTTAAGAAADEHVDLVWAAAQALGPRDASLLDLHLRHGLGAAELAEALEVTPNNAHQLLFRLKGKLEGAIRAWVLWRDGRPACDALGRALASAGVTRFGAEAVRATSRHVAGCEACAERQQTRLSPQAMFAAVPVLAVAPLVKAQAAAALSAAGVPVGPGVPTTGPGPAAPPDHPAGPGGTQRGAPHGAPGRRSAGRRLALVAAVVAVVVTVLAVADPLGDGSAPLDVAVGTTLGTVPPTAAAGAPPGTSAGTLELGGAAPTTGPTASPDAPPATDPAQLDADPGGSPATPPAGDPGDGAVDTTPPPPPPAPPTIGGFRATAGQGAGCGRGAMPVTLVWQSTGATSAALAGPGAPVGDLAPSGTAVACAPVGGADPRYALTVTGPGGTATGEAAA
jgi:RNA polymerase sigma factor (sigma-70 family)